jgi:outer membrane protein assembly factor BamB
LALLVLALTPAAVQGQSATDFPTYKGDNGRSGKNGAPDSDNPGLANLTWWQVGVGAGYVPSLIIDDSNPTAVTYTPQANWLVPPTGDSAGGAYYGTTAGTDAYHYAFTVASSLTSNTNALTGTASIASFTVGPSSNVAGNYKLFVHMPDGPTITSNGTSAQAVYAVVQVVYANSATFTDVINVGEYGNGWIPIGGGGAPTAQVFAYDGSTPFTINIYNTIPRNSSGTLMDTPGTTVVYADAVEAIADTGSYAASPSVMQVSQTEERVVSAVNQSIQTIQQGTVQTTQQGIVYSWEYDSGVNRWTWEPPGGTVGAILDNNSGGVSVSPPSSWTSSTSATGYYGLDYLTAPITTTRMGAATVTYAPSLVSGNYSIYLWVAGGTGFAQQQEVDVTANNVTTAYTVNMASGGGWVQLGSSQFTNSATYPLSVTITNYSGLGADSSQNAYADAVWFAGQSTGAISSTPVQAMVNIKVGNTVAQKAVVLVATESGKLFCLDAEGNGDGTTKVYWTYPSTPDPANSSWTDPNQVSGLDGPGGIAVMPTTFNTTSALIENVNSEDRLYIASQNGRIYCIDMTGRGDITSTAPGTTTRLWSYPNDYPSTYQESQLGPFNSSLAFSNAVGGNQTYPTIYACTGQGRIYALDAAGDTTAKTTTVTWAYPALTSGVATLPPFTSTPAIDNFGTAGQGILFVGTAATNGPGEFIALNTDGGSGVWGTPVWNAPFTGDSGNALGFYGGPATASATYINENVNTGMPNTVFVANQNGYVYALNASNGKELWETNEIGSDVQGPLSFTFLKVPFTITTGSGNGQTSTQFPPSPLVPGTTPFENALVPVACVMVPTSRGAVYGLYAGSNELTDYTNTSHTAWGYQLNAPLTTDLACGNNFMYAADETGILYAFSSTAYGGGATPPGQQLNNGNNSQSYNRYSMAKLKVMSLTTFQGLSQPPTYDSLNSAQAATTFEYGDTLVAVLYNYPFDGASTQANFAATGPGFSDVPASISSWQITDPTDVPTDGLSDNHLLNGYAVLTLPLDLSQGGQLLQPGSLQISGTSIVSSYFGGQQTFSLPPGQCQTSIQVLNPLALVTEIPQGSTPDAGKAVGFYAPGDPGAKNDSDCNGNPTAPLLGATVGVVTDGQSNKYSVEVIDRSNLHKIKPTTWHLPVSVQASGLAWKGFEGAVKNQLPPWAAGFEDLPNASPNPSYDYPDIHPNQISVTGFDPAGTSYPAQFWTYPVPVQPWGAS